MRILLQRVLRAEVRVRTAAPATDAYVSGRINAGYVVLVGITHTDTATEVDWMVEKIRSLRLFPDEQGRMNRDLQESGGAILVVSQFTLYGDARKGRRPSFLDAAVPNIAEPLYMQLIAKLRARGVTVEAGVFGATMEVELVNDGPVTLWIERDSVIARTHADDL